MRKPFRGMTSEGWQNLAIAGLLFIYGAQVVLDIAWGNVFGNLAVDFASFWTAGRIANQHGYAAVYDLDLVARIQSQVLPARAVDLAGIRPLPAALLPIFILPFQLLALLPAGAAALLWIALTVAGTALYAKHFAARVGGEAIKWRGLLLVMVTLPVFLNAFLGQVNLWLMVCVGEFLVARRMRREYLAGAWIAGLLLKPQVLLVIIPALLLQRWWKSLVGMLAAAVAILAGSWLLAGTEALSRLVDLWIGFASGLPGNDPQLMMNWRMIGVHLQGIIGPQAAAAIVAGGMIATAVAALTMCIRPLGADGLQTAIVVAGLMAATALTAWHAHVHMGIIVIPPLLMLFGSGRKDALRLFNAWIFVPAAIYVLRIPLAALTRAGVLPESLYGILDLMGGLGLFGMNLAVLVWVVRALRPWRTRAS